VQDIKVFWFFSSEKNMLASLYNLSKPRCPVTALAGSTVIPRLGSDRLTGALRPGRCGQDWTGQVQFACWIWRMQAASATSTPFDQRRHEERPSFLKKRSKKLLCLKSAC
jgi:hypothetical protein